MAEQGAHPAAPFTLFRESRERTPRRAASDAAIAARKVEREAAKTAADCYCAASCLCAITADSYRLYLADLQVSQLAVAEAIKTQKKAQAASDAAAEKQRVFGRVVVASREEADEADEADQDD